MSDFENIIPQNKTKQFWKVKNKYGRPTLFGNDYDLLWEQCCEYFEWVDATPLKELKVFNSKGEIKQVEVPLMRAYTLKGLAIYLNVSSNYINTFERRQKEIVEDKTKTKEERELAENFLLVLMRVRDIIFTQKFEGAAARLLDGNLIARELNLADKQVIETSDEPTKIEIEIIDGNGNKENL